MEYVEEEHKRQEAEKKMQSKMEAEGRRQDAMAKEHERAERLKE